MIINLCLVNEGNKIMLEDFDPALDTFANDQDSVFTGQGAEFFFAQLEIGALMVTLVDLADGLTDLDRFFKTHMSKDDASSLKYNHVKEQFVNQTKDAIGKYYLWGVERDWNLCFVSDDEQMEMGDGSCLSEDDE